MISRFPLFVKKIFRKTHKVLPLFSWIWENSKGLAGVGQNTDSGRGIAPLPCNFGFVRRSFAFSPAVYQMGQPQLVEQQASSQVYGENQTNNNQMYESPNGYILFYLRDNSEIVIDGEKKSLTSNFHEKYNNQFINEIEKQNQEILLKFCLFLEPVINFLMNKICNC